MCKIQKDAEVTKLELAAVYDDYKVIKSQVQVDDVVKRAIQEVPDNKPTGREEIKKY